MAKCCEKCGKPLEDGQPCFHVIHGYWEKDGFVPEEEVAYFCDDCGVERGNF